MFDHVAGLVVEADAPRIFDGDVQGFEDEVSALQVDGIGGHGVNDFHERGLDGLLIFDQGDGVNAGLGRNLHAAHHALVEVAELLSAESGGAATDSGDLDVSTDLDIRVTRHIHTSKNFIPFS